MSAVNPDAVTQMAAPEAQGDQPLAPQIVNGVKEFQPHRVVTGWHILPDVDVAAYAFNGQVPGPRLRVTEGDRLRIRVSNQLPEPTSVHWHGLILPNPMDGAAGITQEPIRPGEHLHLRVHR